LPPQFASRQQLPKARGIVLATMPELRHLGVITNILAAWRHLRYIRAFNQSLPIGGRPSVLAIALAVILALLGLLLAFYLGTTTKSPAARPTSSEKRLLPENIGHSLIRLPATHFLPNLCANSFREADPPQFPLSSLSFRLASQPPLGIEMQKEIVQRLGQCRVRKHAVAQCRET
jgi:hypothetical protein